MKLLPGTSAAPAKLDCSPLALAHDRQSSAVDNEMHGLIDRNMMKIDIEVLTTTRERGVIWGFEIDTHQRQD